MDRKLWRTTAVLMAAAISGLAPYGCSGVNDTSSSGATSGDGGPMPVECSVSPPTACPDPAPKYADVEPVFKKKCVTCHYGAPGGPWALTDYQHIADWRNEVRSELIDCSMPPLDAGAPITDDERTLILTWVLCGAPP